MNRIRLLAGLLVAALVGAVVIVQVRRLRRRLVPRWAGPEAVVADIVLVTAWVMIVAELLGTIGWFAPWPLAGALLLTAMVSVGLNRSSSPVATVDQDVAAPAGVARLGRPSVEPGWLRWVVAAGMAAVAVGWSRALPPAYRYGMIEWDSLWYHLPAAADFVQSGSFLETRFYGADIAVATYPFGSEVVHAMAILVTGSDVLSPLVNIVWAIVFLLAAHVFGRRQGCPHLATLAGLLVLATPVVTGLMAATAMNEMMGLAMLTAALACALPDPDDGSIRGRVVIVGAAAGLAIGVKSTMLGPAVALLVGALIVYWRHDRRMLRRALVPLGGAAVATGGFWYFRNVLLFGSPIPVASLGIGKFELGHVQVAGNIGPMLPTLLDGLWSGRLFTVYTWMLGPLWMLYFIAPVVVVPLAIRSRRRRLTTLGIVAACAFVFGTLTPGFLSHGEYLLMTSNTRYLLAGVALSLIVGAVAAATTRRGAPVTAIALTGLLAVTIVAVRQVPVSDASPVGAVHTPWIWIVGAGMLAVGLLAGLRVLNRYTMLLPSVCTVVVVGVLVAITVVQPRYLASRYQNTDGLGSDPPVALDPVFSWTQKHTGLRIAVQPYAFADLITTDARLVARGNQVLLFTYGLYGRDLSNRVAPAARFDGTRVTRPDSCAQWWAQLRRDRATHVVIWDPGDGSAQSRYRAWTERSPAARLVARGAVSRPPAARLLLYSVNVAASPPCRR